MPLRLLGRVIPGFLAVRDLYILYWASHPKLLQS